MAYQSFTNQTKKVEGNSPLWAVAAGAFAGLCVVLLANQSATSLHSSVAVPTTPIVAQVTFHLFPFNAQMLPTRTRWPAIKPHWHTMHKSLNWKVKFLQTSPWRFPLRQTLPFWCETLWKTIFFSWTSRLALVAVCCWSLGCSSTFWRNHQNKPFHFLLLCNLFRYSFILFLKCFDCLSGASSITDGAFGYRDGRCPHISCVDGSDSRFQFCLSAKCVSGSSFL